MDSSDIAKDVAYAYMYEDGYISNKVNNRNNKLAFWNGGQDAGSTLQIRYATTTTGVKNVTVDEAVSTGVYDLQGRKVNVVTSGVYVIDGQAVYVR